MENSELIVAAPLLNKVGRVHLIDCNGLWHARIDLTDIYTGTRGFPNLNIKAGYWYVAYTQGWVRLGIGMS